MDQNEWTNPWPEEEHKVFAHVTAALVDGRIEFRDDDVPVIVGKEDGVKE